MATKLSTRYLDPSFERVARKEHVCRGSGGRPSRYAEGHHAVIQPGEQYVEYCGEVGGFQSGYAYCMACADAFMLATK